MSRAAQPNLIWRLVEESLSEAAYLWSRLDQALDATDHTLADVERWVERRLFGALDGVRLAGAHAISPMLTEAFADSDPGLVGAAAYLLATLSSHEAAGALEQGLRELPDEQVDGVARALGRAANVALLRSLWSRMQDASSSGAACLLEAFAFCGEVPGTAFDAKALLTAEQAVLRRASASALALLAPAQRSEVMWVALQSPDLEVRKRASIAGLSAGDSNAWRRSCEAVRARNPQLTDPLAMFMVAMLGTRDEQAHLCEAVNVPELTCDALRALSFAGSRDAVDACVATVLGGEHVDLACQAIVAITGVDLSQLTAAAQPVLDASSADKPLAANVPDGPALQSWWRGEREKLDPRARYHRGKLKTLARLKEELSHGPTRRRHAIALELSVRSRGAYRIQTQAFCSEQRLQMARLAELSARELRDASSALGIEPLAED